MSNELLIPDKIIRCKRKSIAIIINNNNELVVRAPNSCQDKAIKDFIIKKSAWIIEKRNKNIQCGYKPLNMEDDELIPILNHIYRIKLIERGRVKVTNDELQINASNSRSKLISYLKRIAYEYISEKAKQIAEQNNLYFASISISQAKTRWGSCSFNNKLNFTYKLILCPSNVVDYVIAHELTHTVVKNHSKLFYSKLKSIFTDYQNSEKWLKDNRQIINMI